MSCKAIFVAGLLMFYAGGVSAADSETVFELDEEDIYARLVVRSADQLSAFYQGREFPDSALKEILKVCMITPIIKNRQYDVAWIKLDQWQFTVDDKVISRLDRSWWKTVWQKQALPLRFQATFGWTLMPEERDLRLDEGVGGSVVIPWQDKPVNLLIRLPVEQGDKKSMREIEFKGIMCSGKS